MAILESIAAANAAYSVIKTALGNGRETAGLMSSIGRFLAAEEDIKEAVKKKKSSPLTAITGGDDNIIGRYIIMTSGTAKHEAARITDYVDATGAMTVTTMALTVAADDTGIII